MLLTSAPDKRLDDAHQHTHAISDRSVAFAEQFPTLFQSIGTITTEMIIRVIGLNAALGCFDACSHARNALEAAMLAPAATHIGMVRAATLFSF